MKQFIALFLTLSLALADTTVFVSRISAGGGGGSDVSENFEGTGTPSGWTVTIATPGFDQATTGLSLEASQCLYMTVNAAAEETYVAFTASDNAYAYFLMRMEDVPGGADRTQFKFTDGSANDLAIQAASVGPVQMKLYDGGAGSDPGAATMSADTTYHVWFEYEKGTGANGKVRVYFASSGTKPASPDAEITTSAMTGQAARLYFGNDWSGSGGNIYYDKVRVSRTAAFGDNPS
jgi:hypothetical protein